MKTLLLDQGLPRSTIKCLHDAGFESVHVGELGMAAASDVEILDMNSGGQKRFTRAVKMGSKWMNGAEVRVSPASIGRDFDSSSSSPQAGSAQRDKPSPTWEMVLPSEFAHSAFSASLRFKKLDLAKCIE
ncbi:MAG: DUF5615 family PIN-like protein [Opitutales bacterium]